MKQFALARILMFLAVLIFVPMFFTSEYNQAQFNIQIATLFVLYLTVDVATLLHDGDEPEPEQPEVEINIDVDQVLENARTRKHIRTIFHLLDGITLNQKQLLSMIKDNQAKDDRLVEMIRACDNNVGELIEIVDTLVEKKIAP